MPELAEVEYFRKRWDAGLGKRVTAVELHGEKRLFRETDVSALKRLLVREKLLRSAARGKQMLFVLSGGNWLGIHLGMSGKLRVEGARFEAGQHDHLVLRQKDRALVLSDPRQFGLVRFHHGPKIPAWWEVNAPEIHSREFTRASMQKFLSLHARAPIKAVLLLQKGFPGVGNWMADEILWRARIVPRTRVGRLSEKRVGAIWRATRFVARAALKTIGRNFADPPKDWLLHVRWGAGGKCPRDGSPLRRARVGGRTTVWCPHCQR
jgi:formamidopyrimidine-DNA glycosylase